jgi:rhamnosyltransferase
MKAIVIYVTYNANFDLFRKSIKSIDTQTDRIIIIDNTPNKDKNLEKIKNANIEIIYLENNLGIAKAQNIGIKKALEYGYDYVMLSDQDTIYPNNYINNMLKVFNIYDNVAAVGPRYMDCNKNSSDGFISLKPIIFKQIFPKNGKHEVMQLISSGKIINLKYLNDIGLMEEKLFIDWVDLEWCWRARKKGYKIIGNADVIIEHRLGNISKDIGYREVNLRNPIRHYYITRNAFYLSIRNKNLDIFHKLTLFLKSFRYIIGYPILSKPHEENLKFVLLGLYHGLCGKVGKYKEIK